MNETTNLILVIIGIIAVIMNLIGLVRAFIAHKKFLSGWYKKTIVSVFVLVCFLNIVIIMDVINHGYLYFTENIAMNLTLSQIILLFVIITAICTIVASILNLITAKEYGFR